jgi:anion transporter
MRNSSSAEITDILIVDRRQSLWLLLASTLMVAVLCLPIAGLGVAGQRALAIAAFAVVVWVTECISYPLSAFIICALEIFLLGYAPNPDNPSQLLGLSGAFRIAFAGWIEEMVWFMMGGLVIAISMNATGLDRRIAVWIVSRFKTAKGVLLGIIIAMNVLALLMPPITGRTAAMVPIIVGIVSVFGQPLTSRFAAYIGVTMAIIANTSAFGLLSGASMNPLVALLVEKATGVSISWLQWFIWFFPFTVVMSAALYFLMNILIKPEIDEVPGGTDAIRKIYDDLGPWTAAQKRLLILSLITVFFWATNGILFSLNLTAITLVAISTFMLPGVGVISWETLEKRLPWSTLVLFATGIALGMILLKTKAAVWLANATFNYIGLPAMGIITATLLFSVIGVILHFGFSSATALCATYIPVVIAYIQSNDRADLSLVGIPLIVLIATGLTMLVVNTPNTMIAYGSKTFTARQFMIAGLINTIISLVMITLFTATYWHWLGII